MVTSDVNWPGGTYHLTWVPAPSISNRPFGTAHCFCFQGSDILVVELGETARQKYQLPQESRGLTIPGGHLESSESLETCVEREVLEEACVQLRDLAYLGFADVRGPESSKAPVIGPLAFFRADVDQVLPFRARYEMLSRQFVPTERLPVLHYEWYAVLQAAFEQAIGEDTKIETAHGRRSSRAI